MAVPVTAVETGHTDQVHDSQFDYYGRRLATCSSDSYIRIFNVQNDQSHHVADLIGHQGPVWQIAWAHPKFGSILASASFDHTVIVWKEDQQGQWQILHRTDTSLHTGSINSVSWAPHDLGLMFAMASSDGSLSVHACTVETGEWSVSYVTDDNGAPAHPMGATAVSFAPALEAGALVSNRMKQQGPVRRIASGGCDHAVRIWSQGKDGVWRQEGKPLLGHGGWVRDVAWAPNLGLPRHCIASAGQDGKVVAWTEDAADPMNWKMSTVRDFGKEKPAWSVSWNAAGNVLAVSAAGADDIEATVELMKEAADGHWETVAGPVAEQ